MPMAGPKRSTIIALAAAAGVLGAVVAQPRWAFRGLARLFPGIVWQVETDEPLIALTFDDGPDPVFTPQVLALLAQSRARATFFLVGEHARRHPEWVVRIRAAGHEIGNHTDAMKTTLWMSAAEFERSLMRSEETLGLAGRQGGGRDGPAHPSPAGHKFLRPAGGGIRPAQLRRARQHGYTCVLGSAYAFDPYRPPAAYIRWAISRNLEPGGIVVLHDAGGNRSNTVGALAGILADARARGLRLVTLSELVEAGRRHARRGGRSAPGDSR